MKISEIVRIAKAVENVALGYIDKKTCNRLDVRFCGNEYETADSIVISAIIPGKSACSFSVGNKPFMIIESGTEDLRKMTAFLGGSGYIVIYTAPVDAKFGGIRVYRSANKRMELGIIENGIEKIKVVPLEDAIRSAKSKGD